MEERGGGDQREKGGGGKKRGSWAVFSGCRLHEGEEGRKERGEKRRCVRVYATLPEGEKTRKKRGGKEGGGRRGSLENIIKPDY